MKFAIVIATYQRADGATPELLTKTLDSVYNQIHKEFKVFLIGDCYTNNNEFEQFSHAYFNKFELYTTNLKIAVERTKYKDNKRYKWNNGGVTACNTGVNQALNEGYTYICHLDHDDIWDKTHLILINDVIHKYKADFICTKSTHKTTSRVLPNIKNKNQLYVDYIPKPEDVIHSATCYNYKTILLRLRDSENLPADYDLWRRMHRYISKNNLKSICINKITCSHLQEFKGVT